MKRNLLFQLEPVFSEHLRHYTSDLLGQTQLGQLVGTAIEKLVVGLRNRGSDWSTLYD